MPVQANKAAVERYGELWTTGDLAIVDELLTDDFVICNSEGGEPAGRAAFKAGVAAHFDNLTGFAVSIDDVVAEGDLVTIRFTAHGTHSGPFQGSVPSGKPLIWTGMQLLRFRYGKIASIGHQPDELSLQRQLGRVRETAPAGA